ncbi:MAG: PQQ-binding-like beta-propeller repeat protein [Frankiaceae bacterium]|nr:PQQ-binding-like beta-propeller repeat protein [Frankiaceae bacterium]
MTCSTPCAATGTWGSFLLGDPVLSGTNILISDTNGVEVYPTSCGATCSPAWSGYGNLTSAFPVSSPAVAASGRFFASGHDMTTWDGRLEAYNAAGCGNPNCPPVWDANLGSEWDASVHTPVVSNGSVYVTGDDTRVYAFKVGGCAASPCAPRWTFDRGINIGTTPAVSHGVVYVAGDLGLEALDAGTGALLWHGDLPSVSDESSPVVANGVVYVTSGDRGTSSELWAFPASCSGTCAPLWHSVVSATGYASPPVVVNGTVYDASGDGGLYAYDQNDPITPAARPRLSALTPDRSLSRIPG